MSTSNTLTYTKVVALPKGWKEDENSFYNFNSKMVIASGAISSLFADPILEVDEVEVTISATVSVPSDNTDKKLDDTFWISVATGEYND